MNNFLETISKTPLFHGLPHEQLGKIEKIAVKREMSRGELIFSEGDEGDGFYVVAQGRIKVFKVSLEGKEQILHILGVGEPFGEVPVFAGDVFPANAQALEKGSLLFFPREAFVKFISENVPVVLNMLGVLSLRLRQFALQIENLSLKEVPARLAGYLLFLSEEQQATEVVSLPIPKGQLASLLGTIPETLSRILLKMRDRGLLEVDGCNIKIFDMEGLEDLSANGKI